MALYSLHISVFLKSTICSVMEQTRTVQLADYVAFVRLSNSTQGIPYSIFFRLPTSIEFNGTMSSIDFDLNFLSVCLIRYVRP